MSVKTATSFLCCIDTRGAMLTGSVEVGRPSSLSPTKSSDQEAVLLAQVEEVERRFCAAAQPRPGVGRPDLADAVPGVDDDRALGGVAQIQPGARVEYRVAGHRERRGKRDE